jgi:CubicO group peptidase (beta-lactamase class C family)
MEKSYWKNTSAHLLKIVLGTGASAEKTLSAFYIGIANQEGKLKLSDTTSKYIGKGWTSMTQAQEDKVTIWHQLTMTSGMIDLRIFFDCTSKACLKYIADAGTRWVYHHL